MKINERVKKLIKNWLEIEELGTNNFIMVRDLDNAQVQMFKNEIWYRGNPSELQQFYEQYDDGVNRTNFWAGIATTGINFRKVHTGLPALIIDKLTDIVVDDMNDIKIMAKDSKGESIENIQDTERWNIIAEEHDFKDTILKEAVRESLNGDCALKMAFDPDVSEFPIIEVVPGKYIEYVYKRGRLQEIKFLFPKNVDGKIYAREEIYSKAGVEYKYYDENGKDITIGNIDQEEGLYPFENNYKFLLAIPLMITKSKRYPGRGKGILEEKEGALDSFDEVWSQWMDALRDGRTKTYIPDDLIPRDPKTGVPLRPNTFDKRFIGTKSNKAEGADNKIQVESPEIKSEQYLETYITALDLCLQGIISPSTLGIDVKKLDNAEAQREKEKTTLYTRGKIIRKLEKLIPSLVELVLKTDDLVKNKGVKPYEVSVDFGEYANPSFEAQVETVGKAFVDGVMSIETAIEQLYGDTWTEDEKAEEVERLKTRDSVNEPQINDTDVPLLNEPIEEIEEEIE